MKKPLRSARFAGRIFTPISFVLLILSLPYMARAELIEVRVEHRLPFSRSAPETAARRIARTAAWLEALKSAMDALASGSIIRSIAENETDGQALVSAVFTPIIRITSGRRQVFVELRLSASRAAVEKALRKMLPEREMLELRAEILKQAREKVAGARELLKPPDTRHLRTVRGAARKIRFVLFAEQLEALWLLEGILAQRENGRWRDPEAALPVLRQAAKLDEKYAPLHYLCGEVLFQLDRPQDALVELDRALLLNPDLAGAYHARGLTYLMLGLPALAEHDLDAALERNASYASWWRARGALRMLRNETVPMCEDFVHACSRGDCEGLALARERGLCSLEK